MRHEASRAFATLVKSCGSRELGVSDDLRDYARKFLQKSTAPEVVSLPL